YKFVRPAESDPLGPVQRPHDEPTSCRLHPGLLQKAAVVDPGLLPLLRGEGPGEAEGPGLGDHLRPLRPGQWGQLRGGAVLEKLEHQGPAAAANAAQGQAHGGGGLALPVSAVDVYHVPPPPRDQWLFRSSSSCFTSQSFWLRST